MYTKLRNLSNWFSVINIHFPRRSYYTYFITRLIGKNVILWSDSLLNYLHDMQHDNQTPRSGKGLSKSNVTTTVKMPLEKYHSRVTSNWWHSRIFYKELKYQERHWRIFHLYPICGTSTYLLLWQNNREQKELMIILKLIKCTSSA